MTGLLNRRHVLLGAMGILIVPTGVWAADPVTHVIEIRNLKFAPHVLSVRVGDRVWWINRDIAPHTATADDGSWDTGELSLGEGATIEITANQSTSYFCAFHPHMRGALHLGG